MCVIGCEENGGKVPDRLHQQKYDGAKSDPPTVVTQRRWK